MEPLELNGVRLKMYDCKESAGENGRMISFILKVTSETYHDIAVLLYEKTFDNKAPKRGLEFRGKITNYYTSVTNLYNKDETDDFFVEMTEI
ncbi:DUF3219 family protein [Bacillus amyloliquefaciens]|uniref:DUF3219 family protein n=1 Tax=Bacillus amyloliquefaciens TaxID=1390 RepID=UPI001ABEB26C|nr:DUF3219 family protein [Bacillus amyloliquefaciens]QTG86503.1 DUF3219 family protein [Bacillus amyloliquefaciens]